MENNIALSIDYLFSNNSEISVGIQRGNNTEIKNFTFLYHIKNQQNYAIKIGYRISKYSRFSRLSDGFDIVTYESINKSKLSMYGLKWYSNNGLFVEVDYIFTSIDELFTDPVGSLTGYDNEQIDMMTINRGKQDYKILTIGKIIRVNNWLFAGATLSINPKNLHLEDTIIGISLGYIF